GVVDQNVEPAELSDSLVDQRLARAFVHNIERYEAAPGAERRHRRLGLLGIARRHRYRSPGSGEPLRHTEPDPAIAARDDSHAPGKIEQRHLPAQRSSFIPFCTPGGAQIRSPQMVTFRRPAPSISASLPA